ncbi:MAG TPA: c-type cytochrome domain-containing protein [Candidatus Acidoferrum sp.]|nr:c-type cytochrome domain-containing protein [Candidatus Acidoferrum sp.]
MKILKITIAVALTAAFGLAVASADDSTGSSTPATLPPASTKTGVTFDTDIKPIFTDACVKCHNSAGQRPPRAGLALDTLAGVLKGSKDGPVLKAGDSAHSDLVLSVAHMGDDPDSFMPKGKNAKMLTPDQIGLIRAWIDQGAK